MLAGVVTAGMAQITEVYRQGFEVGENTTYTVLQGTVAPQTNVAAEGQRSLKLSHTATAAEVVFDTIYLENSSWQHFTLEFQHINNVDPTTCPSTLCGVIYVKRPGIDPDWIQVSQNYYNISEGSYSTYFYDVGNFCMEAYNTWASTTVNNSMWKHERFDFDAFLGSQSATGRKLLVKLALASRSASGSTTAGWYIDDVVLKVSPDAIITPTLQMVDFPDVYAYPNSRGARIAVDVSTSAAQGIDPDSIYVVYKAGHSSDEQRIIMSAVSGANDRYECRIPFYGYDTAMYWHLVARDATSNRNTVTYPSSSTAWSSYACVRGTTNRQNLVSNVASLPVSDTVPFPLYGDSRSEFVLDSAILYNAGYRAGAITSLTFTIAQAVTTSQQRERFQISMANIPTTYTASTDGYFYDNFTKVVYDAPLTISPVSAGTPLNFALQDTFFYAGQDLLVRITYDNVSIDPGATAVRSMPVAGATKKTVYVESNYANLGTDMFNEASYSTNMFITNSGYRPHVLIGAQKNKPLYYDCGISAMAYPNYLQAAFSGGNDSVVVWLKNYGANTINSVPIYFSVDGGTPVAYSWAGTLAGGDSVRVRVSTNQHFAVGFHSIQAWVGDTVRIGSTYQRDHEPYNDTIQDEFIACSGAMSGVIRVGGANPDYTTIDNFLFSLERCGINGPLTVRLAEGEYSEMVLPNIPGISADNTVTFEPQSGHVVFRASSAATSLIDVRFASHVRFRNMDFVRPSSATAQYLVRLSSTSSDVRFEKCLIADSGSTASTALILTSGADSLFVDSCEFYGGLVAVDLTGNSSDSYSTGSYVAHSDFNGQTTNAVKALYQSNLVIEGNWMNDVSSNSSDVLLMQGISGLSRVVNNKIFTSHGASAMGVAQLSGTAQQAVVIANNMISCDDDGSAIQMKTPVNLISATHTLFAYNTVRMNAPNRRNIAAVTVGSGSGTLSSLRVVNNIMVNADANNIAFSYDNRSATNTTVNHNVYYSASSSLNKLVSSVASSLTIWTTLLPSDNASVVVEPTFINAAALDLRAYNSEIRGCGIPVSEVTVDMFGNARDAIQPCAGALEFEALYYDFSIDSVASPEDTYCSIPASIPIQVTIRNSGVRQFDPATSGTLKLHYRYGTTEDSVTVNSLIPATGTAEFTSTTGMTLTSQGQGDEQVELLFWLTSSLDPNATNDTLRYTVTLLYSPAAPTPVSMQVPYGSQQTIAITNGVTYWPMNIYTSGRIAPSRIYWFTDSLATTPFYSGNTMVTAPIYDDTTFFISQRRDIGMMKITEVQVSRTGAGVTNPLPEWFGTSTKMALELTNVGDYAANLNGDTIRVVCSNSSYNKTFVLPDVTVETGATLVLQFYTGTTTDSSKTLYYPMTNTNGSPTATMGFGFVYRDGGGVADAVAFNAITSNAAWTSENVPAYVWTGNGITLTSATAGARRTAWPADPAASPSTTRDYWTIASATDVMTIGSTDQELMVYTPSICMGDKSRVTLSLLSRPAVDIAVEDPEVAEGCGLADETIAVTLHNYGTQTSPAITVHYSDGSGFVASDVLSDGLAAGASMQHVFSQTLNMHAQSDTVYHLRFWVEALSDDLLQTNDTTETNVTSLYTPLIPNLSENQTCVFGETLTMTPPSVDETQETFKWYDRNHNYLTSAHSYTTDVLFLPDTFYVSGVALVPTSYQVGTATTTNTATSLNQPSPYNTLRKYAREQYLYTAEELLAAGVQPGEITSVAFYLDSLLGTNPTVSFTDFIVSVGTTSQTTFLSSGNNWIAVAPYSTVSNFTFSRSDGRGWLVHEFDSAFVWDGTSNLVIQVCRSMETLRSAGLRTTYTSATNRALYKLSNDAPQCSITTSGSTSSYRPNIRFGQGTAACEGEEKELRVTLTNVPDHEATLRWPEGMDSLILSSCSGNTITVEVLNLGTQTLSGYQLSYRIDNGIWNTIASVPSIASTAYATVPIPISTVTPGRHAIQVAVTATGDMNANNDTISYLLPISFCAGDYTIGATGQFETFSAAADTLTAVGVTGPVRFIAQAGSYSGQVNLSAVSGISATNTVTFMSQSGDASDVVLTAAPTAADNYVMNLSDDIAHVTFKNITVRSDAAGNYNNVLSISNASDITFSGVTLRVNGRVNNNNANVVILGDGVHGLHFINTTLDSGYYAIKSGTISSGSDSLSLDSCSITNFWYRGIHVDGINTITIENNTIRSGVNVNAYPLTGVYVANATGLLSIVKNRITLIDTRNGGKTGINIKSAQGASATMDKVLIHNNMISVSGTGNNTDISSGITLDGTSSVLTRFVEVYYNTVRVYTSDNRNTTTAFNSKANVSDVYVMNNVFSNFSTGYAYYVASANSIVSSDYNDYYSTSLSRLAYFGVEASSLAAIRTASEGDEGSVSIQPYFVGDDDLHMTTSNLSGRGFYNAEIPDDIDGNTRPQIPQPTLGAHEFPMPAHDVSVAEIVHPVRSDDIVEGDTVAVVVSFYNNGSSTESNLVWTAELVGVADAQVATATVASITSQNMVTDTAYLILPYGVIDSQTVRVSFTLAGDLVEENNTLTTRIYVAPAFNINASAVAVSTGSPVAGCRLQDAVVTMTLRNVGRKAIPTTIPLTIGYDVVMASEGQTVPNIPIHHSESLTLDSDLPVNGTRNIDFVTTANLYPTGLDTSITVRVRGWLHYPYDLVESNDTTPYISKQSHYTPASPVGEDVHIPYATNTVLHATQANQRPIIWYRDSTANAVYTGSNNYNLSTTYSGMLNSQPQLFNDTVLYLNCKSERNCPSYFSEIHVYLNPRVASDVSAAAILTPTTGHVFVERDTVTVRIANYSSRPISNIPVTYRFYKNDTTAQNLLSEVTEVYSGPLAVDATIDYAFDSLVTIPQEYFNTAHTYYIKAWTDLSTDEVRQNDTVRRPLMFQTKAETDYCTPTVSNRDQLDITRIAFSDFDWEMPAVGRGYTNLSSFTNNETGRIVVPHVLNDSVLVSFANSDSVDDRVTPARLCLYIDYNRSGSFDSTELVFHTIVTAGQDVVMPLEIPNTAVCGYTKARFILDQDTSAAARSCVTVEHGHVVDLLLFLEKDIPNIDVAAAKISRTNRFVDDTPVGVGFTMLNKGASVLNTVNVHYTYFNIIDSTVTDSTITWRGSMPSGTSAFVTLPEYTFHSGTTLVTIVLAANGDERSENDTLHYEYHHSFVKMPTLDDNFDRMDVWYAPKGYNVYSRNFWQLGTPDKTNITAASSAPNAWTTDLHDTIRTGRRGALCYLYSPVIDISQVRADSIAFSIAKNLLNGSRVMLQYCNIQGKWVSLQLNENYSGFDWFDTLDYFTGNTENYDYVNLRVPISAFVTDFPEQMQLRFVYYVPIGNSVNSIFGDGCAIDDFYYHRAQRSVDVGVLEILSPTTLALGMTEQPTVTLINYGFDTIRSVPVAYRTYGTYLPREEVFTGVIAPNGGTAQFTFSPNSAFTVTSDYPEEFTICVFTRTSSDLYHDNDTACLDYTLIPLDYDVKMIAILEPGEHAMAGDSLAVTVRVRNYGQNGLASLPVAVSINNDSHQEIIDFNSLLGRELEPMEYFNYTFTRHFLVTMGIMEITAYTNLPDDSYRLNDTLVTRVEGITSITDLKAKEIVLNGNRVQLTVSNIGSRVTYGFEVGYFYDDDTTTMVRQSYTGTINALSNGYVLFNSQLPVRSAPYERVTAFVVADDDNDPSNDTTSIIVPATIDIRANKIFVEENMADTCHVRIQLENVGNYIHTGAFTITAVINGTTIESHASNAMQPGRPYAIDFTQTIPKSPEREYVGVGIFSSTLDANDDNNQTSVVEVVNHFEGVPTVEEGPIYVLEQNIPNPYSHTTHIAFSIPKATRVHFFVMDAMGHLCYQSIRHCEAGRNSMQLSSDELQLSSGVYFYGIACDGQRLMRKMIVR